MKWKKSTEKFLGGMLFIKVTHKLCVTSTKKYYSTTDRYICPISLQTPHCVKQLRIPTESRQCMELPSNKEKDANLFAYFFNPFIVTNWRLCVLKLLVLSKVPTSIRTSSTSLKSKVFHYHKAQSLIYAQMFESLDNAWFYTCIL